VRKLLQKSIRRDSTLSIITLILLETTVIALSQTPSWILPINITPALTEQNINTHLLVSGKSIQEEITGGQNHSYSIPLNSGQYLRLVIEQWGVEAELIFYSPDGQMLTGSRCRQHGPTPVSLIAQASGNYRLEVRSPEKDSATGRYALRVEELRPALLQDRSRIASELSFAEAERLRAQYTAEASRKAIEKYKDALSGWKAVSDRREEANTLNAIGEVYQLLNDLRKALRYYNAALSLSRRADDRQGEGEMLGNIGGVYLSLGENRKALEICARALKVSQSVGHRRGEVKALNNIGEIHNFSGSSERALSYYDEALSLARDLGDRRDQAQTLLFLGYTYSDLNDTQKAFDSYNSALLLWHAVNDRRGEALTLAAIAHLHSKLGEKQEALNLYNQAMPLIQNMDDRLWEAGILNGIGYVYDELGEKTRALDYYNNALRLFQSLGYSYGEAGTLTKIGMIYASLEDNNKALSYYQQALSVSRSLADRRMKSYPLGYIGKVYESLGDKKKALYYFNQALSLNQAGGDHRQEAYTLNNIGHVYEGLGEKRKAMEYYHQALSLNRTAGDRFGESATLYNLARAERDTGNLTEARARIEAALEIIESLRTKVAGQELRASYFASINQHYEFYIDLLMRSHQRRPSEGFEVAALQASERARARSLLDTLTEARANITQGSDAGLLAREHSLQQLLDDKAERQMRLLGGKHTEEEASAIAKEIDEITTEYNEVKAQIRATSPRYAALTQPQPLGLKEIQQEVLDDDTLLLEYALGDEKSYLWKVTRDSINGYELPGRAEIEGAARRMYELLKAQQPVPGETLAERQSRAAEADAQYWQEAVALSQMVLGPVAAELGKKRLLIVADGALQYIPFGALIAHGPTPQDDTPTQANGTEYARETVPLIVEHEIVTLPSASTLAVLRRETAQRAPAPNTVAVLADPVFEKDDPRIPSPFRARVSATAEQEEERTEVAELRTAVRDAGGLGDGGSIPRLLASREEAQAIMRMTPAGAGLNATGFDASRATATSPELSKYRIVHFATHGLLNSEHPELSGVVLSLVDQRGQPVNGFLRLHDIYNLNLPADLIVLSACNTGLGKEVKGEGLIGLTRGFMYAGAAGVMASLWKVDDEATAELMKHFYSGMLKDGLPPAAALRQAQIKMLQQKRWRSPYYWAAFVLQGEYRKTINLDDHTRPGGRAIVAAVAVVLAFSIGGGLYAARRRRRRARDTGSD
jgi:CHAT domain-containing protein/tetratricopeptide (TPR) repeat protein